MAILPYLYLKGNTLTDTSANAFTITNSGVSVSATTSPAGNQTLYFGNNQNDYMSILAADFSFGINDFTVECFFKYDNTMDPDYEHSIFSSNNGTSGITLAITTTTPNKITFYVTKGGEAVIYEILNVTDNVWYHFAFARKNGIGRTYLNGQLIETKICSFDINSSLIPSRIGYGIGSYEGYISNLRIYNGAAIYDPVYQPFGFNFIDTYNTLDKSQNRRFFIYNLTSFDVERNPTNLLPAPIFSKTPGVPSLISSTTSYRLTRG